MFCVFEITYKLKDKSKLKNKQDKQKASPKNYTTEFKILANHGSFRLLLAPGFHAAIFFLSV